MNTPLSIVPIEIHSAQPAAVPTPDSARQGLRVRSGLRAGTSAGSTTKSSDKAQKQLNDFLRG